MLSVMISIQPFWCGEIASEKKNAEIRKTQPKATEPFKCYNDGHVEWQKKAEELQVENAQLRKERDVAVAELKGVCRVCKHSRPHKEYSGMHTCKFRDCIAHKGRVRTCKHWEWRGVQEDKK